MVPHGAWSYPSASGPPRAERGPRGVIYAAVEPPGAGGVTLLSARKVPKKAVFVQTGRGAGGAHRAHNPAQNATECPYVTIVVKGGSLSHPRGQRM